MNLLIGNKHSCWTQQWQEAKIEKQRILIEPGGELKFFTRSHQLPLKWEFVATKSHTKPTF